MVASLLHYCTHREAWKTSSNEKSSTQWRAAILTCVSSTRSPANSQMDGWAIGEGLIRRCLSRRAFHVCKMRKYSSAGPPPLWRTSQGCWWSLDIALSRSRQNASDLREDRRHD